MSTNGKLTSAEWDIICAVEEHWFKNHCFPTVDEIVRMTELSPELIESQLQSERCQKRFIALGIDPKQAPQNGSPSPKESRLSYMQLAAANVILNPFDKRPQTHKLKSLGIPPATFQGWMKSKSFTTYLRDRSEEMFGDAMPMMQDALIRQGMAGSVSAIKLYMEMQGRYNSKSNESIQDFRMLVYRLIEVLQKHIRDPILLQIISDEIKSIVDPTVVRGEVENGEYSPIISQRTGIE